LSETPGQKLVDEVGRFRKALVKRIRRVNQLTEGEVMSAASGLRKIVDLATQLSAHTKETLSGVTGEEEHGGVSLAESIAKQSDTTEDFIDGLNSKIGEQREVAARAHQQSREILRAAKSVERLSQQSNIIALNAMVEAARRGEHGTSFSVIPMRCKGSAERSRRPIR
jgi:methyl-accepting chemotaxis protein